MKTFSTKVKIELAKIKVLEYNEALSELSALVKSAGEIRKNGSDFFVVISTELPEIYETVNQLLEVLYKDCAELEISDETIYNKTQYEIKLSKELSKLVLFDTEIGYFDENKIFCINDGISKYLLEEKEQMIGYVRGMFLGCFSSNIKFKDEKDNLVKNKNTGYHIEFSCRNNVLAQDFSELLAQFDIYSKKLNRKDYFVVYVKEFEQICDILASIGATKSVLDLQEENAIRDMRNQINRQNNCLQGNITKTINASVEQVEYIDKINKQIGIENLDIELQEVCYLRLANPEESIESLAKLSTSNITKSGIYHRLKRVEKIAKELK